MNKGVILKAQAAAETYILHPAAQYGVSLDSVVSFKAGDNELEIVEHFEQHTERRTHISVSQ